MTTCHVCDQPATHHWQRDATPDEAAQYHANVDTWRTSQGLGPMPDDAAIKTAPVQIPVFGCSQHSATDTAGPDCDDHGKPDAAQ